MGLFSRPILSQRNLEGELLIDHRASPGISETDAREAGYDPSLCKEGKTFEAATLTCSHCRCVVVKNPLRTRDRGFCTKCHHYICDWCATAMQQPDYVHTPFEKFAEDTIAGRIVSLKQIQAAVQPPSLALLLPPHSGRQSP